MTQEEIDAIELSELLEREIREEIEAIAKYLEGIPACVALKIPEDIRSGKYLIILS